MSRVPLVAPSGVLNRSRIRSLLPDWGEWLTEPEIRPEAFALLISRHPLYDPEGLQLLRFRPGTKQHMKPARRGDLLVPDLSHAGTVAQIIQGIGERTKLQHGPFYDPTCEGHHRLSYMVPDGAFLTRLTFCLHVPAPSESYEQGIGILLYTALERASMLLTQS